MSRPIIFGSAGLGVTLAVVACLAGCKSSPKAPPGPPALTTSDRLFVGTPLSGPLDDSPAVSTALVSQVAVRWIALQRMPAEVLAPIDSQAKLTVAPNSDTTLVTSARLTRPVRFGHSGSAVAFLTALNAGRLGDWTEITSRTGLVAPGMTRQFTVLPAHSSLDNAKHVTLSVSPLATGGAAASPRTTLVAVLIADRPSTGEGPDTGRIVKETAVVDAVPATDGAQFVVAMPFGTPGSPWTALAAVATVQTSAVDQAAVAQLEDDARRASSIIRAGISRSPSGDGATIQSALGALRRPDSVRPATLLLTTLSNARIAGDFALVAEDIQLAQLAEETFRFLPADALPPLADLRWFLDRYAVRTMCEAAEKNKLSPELQSVLAIHAGDVARRPDAIMEVLQQVGNSDALAERLLAENLIALEDNSPASRVRAFDWLNAQGKAPAGFDPLADAKSRRAAIDKAMSSQGGPP